ncbi:hypothetical protein V1292_003030 [Bradyrhizobium sp. AZCC 1719]
MRETIMKVPNIASLIRATHARHCEERSDEAIHISICRAMDCFASLAKTVW